MVTTATSPPVSPGPPLRTRRRSLEVASLLTDEARPLGALGVLSTLGRQHGAAFPSYMPRTGRVLRLPRPVVSRA
eukprot:10780324-Alexandrium_andersonii.AAC.1